MLAAELPRRVLAKLNKRLRDFLLAYNHAKRLKTPHGLTPHEYV